MKHEKQGSEPRLSGPAAPSSFPKTATLTGGVLILTVANLLVKVLGFAYKVPLNGMLGDEMANVNAAYSVYALLYMISTAGVPVAVSVLIARTLGRSASQERERIFKVALSTLAVIGGAGSLLLLLSARGIAAANSGGDSYLCLLAIAPALFFISISAVYRGYFQGYSLMRPTAVSTVLEALGKTVIGVLLVVLILSRGEDTRLAAAFSVFGITVGIALGCFYLIIERARLKRELVPESSVSESPAPVSRLIVSLLSISLPIALTSGVLSLSSLIDGQLMRPLLVSYYGDEAMAKAVYSDYSTGATTLFNMPAVLIYPIACAIVPYITSALGRGDREAAGEVVASSFRIGAMIALPSALGMSILSYPILRAVFVGDLDMAHYAGGPLSLLALSILPLGILSLSNAVLQAYGKQNRPLFSMIAAIAVKILVILLATPLLGPLAAPLSTLLFYAAAALINLFFVFRYTGFSPSWVRSFLLPLIGAAAAAAAAYGLYLITAPLGVMVALALSILAAVSVYAVFVLLSGVLSGEDLALLPGGKKVICCLQKLHFIPYEE